MVERLGDDEIEPQFREKMNVLAAALDELFNGDTAMPRREMRKDQRKVGFVLLVFEFGDNPASRCNFISNGADRKDVVALFKEMIYRFEGGVETEGHG